MGQEGAFTTSTEALITTDIVPGQQYYFQVRAHNNMGWGPFSSFTIMASAVPEKADPAVTVISGANVLATIVLPSNNGATISLVNWYVANSLGVFVKI
jgi:hypothetical protein